MGALNENIFGKKKFSDLLEEIYGNQKKREKQIEALIQQLKPLIKDVGDATLIVPLLANYLDMGLKNDDQLIKMATIIQRIFNNNSSSEGGDFIISPEERAQLMETVDKLHKDDKK